MDPLLLAAATMVAGVLALAVDHGAGHPTIFSAVLNLTCLGPVAHMGVTGSVEPVAAVVVALILLAQLVRFTLHRRTMRDE